MLLLLAGVSLAQSQFGNEWIVPGQSYAKIGISENGLYRVTYAELVSAGFAVEGIQPKQLQLFHHGREVPIDVIGEADGRFDATDFIQFYAEKNQGELDSLVYYQAARANPYQSLFSDETFYFLTVGQQPGKRIPTHTAPATTQVPETYHLNEQVTAYAVQYSFNNSIGLVPSVQQSYYEEGEGWTGPYISPDTAATFTMAFRNRVQVPGVAPYLEFQVNGRSLSNHQLWYALNQRTPMDTVSFGPFNPKRIGFKLPENAVTNEMVTLKTQSLKAAGTDWYSMTYVKVVYPQQLLMSGLNSKYFYLRPNDLNQSVVSIKDVNDNYSAFVVTNRHEVIKLPLKANQVVVPQTATRQTLFMTNELKKSGRISMVNFPVIDPKAYSYLIITHASLRESASQYAAYRASAAGGGYKPLIIETKDIYDQFNFGERSPFALRRFADYMLSGGRDKHLFLLGRGISFPDVLKTAAAEDLVPTFGYPGSDALLTMGLAGFDEFVQAIPTGRLNVTSNQQVINYLTKVKEAELALARPDDWQKRILHLNGGHDKAEILYLKSLMEELRPVAESPYMGAEVKTLSKKSIDEVEAVDISKEVNEGVSMISYTGHGSSNTLDFNIGYCSPPTSNFRNKGKYPILFFNGCSINNIFYKYDPLSTDWLITPDKGAIAVLAGSFWSYPATTQVYVSTLYQKLFADSTSLTLTLGQIQQRVNQQLSPQRDNLTLRSDLQQIILQGDPALHAFPLAKPDYTVKGLFVQSRNMSTTIAASDSLNVGLIFSNVGRFLNQQPVTVVLKKTYAPNDVRTEQHTLYPATVRDTVLFPLKKDVTLKQLEVTMDGDFRIDELNEANNQQRIDLENWSKIEKNSVYPTNALADRLNPVMSVLIDNRAIKNGDHVSADPIIQIRLTDENQLPVDPLASIQLYLKTCESCPFVTLAPQSGSAMSPVSVLITYQLTNLPAGTYELLATGRDAAGNAAGNGYAIRFSVAENEDPVSWRLYPNPGTETIQVGFTLVGKVPPAVAQLLFFNSSGVLVDSCTLIPFIGENIFYWEKLRLMPAGTYMATLQIRWYDGRLETVKSKLIKH